MMVDTHSKMFESSLGLALAQAVVHKSNKNKNNKNNKNKNKNNKNNKNKNKNNKKKLQRKNSKNKNKPEKKEIVPSEILEWMVCWNSESTLGKLKEHRRCTRSGEEDVVRMLLKEAGRDWRAMNVQERWWNAATTPTYFVHRTVVVERFLAIIDAKHKAIWTSQPCD